MIISTVSGANLGGAHLANVHLKVRNHLFFAWNLDFSHCFSGTFFWLALFSILFFYPPLPTWNCGSTPELEKNTDMFVCSDFFFYCFGEEAMRKKSEKLWFVEIIYRHGAYLCLPTFWWGDILFCPVCLSVTILHRNYICTQSIPCVQHPMSFHYYLIC